MRHLPALLAVFCLAVLCLRAGEGEWQRGFLGKAEFNGTLKGSSAETEWELVFTRKGRALDATGGVHEVNQPIFNREGLRMAGGRETEYSDSSGAITNHAGIFQTREILSLPPVLTQRMPEDDFTVLVTFSVFKTGGLYQTVFEQTRRQRWWPTLHLGFRSQHRNQLTLHHADRTDSSAKRFAETGVLPETGRVYTVVLTRQRGTAKVWVDGVKRAELAGIPVEDVSDWNLGCGGPERALDGHLRTFAAWDRALDEEEVAAIDLNDLATAGLVRVTPLRYIRHLARGFEPRSYSFQVRNLSDTALEGVAFEWEIGDQRFTQPVGRLEAQGERVIDVPVLITLKPGDTVQTFSVTAGGKALNRQSLPATVTPAPVPVNQLQTSSWCQFLPGEPGYTMATVRHCADAMLAGLHWGPVQLRWTGWARADHPEDRAFTPHQKRSYNDFYFSERMREQMRVCTDGIVRRLAFYPALTHIDINNEYNPNFQVNFSEPARRYAAEHFGLDLTPWMGDGKRELVRPIGRLSPVLANYPIPASRIIPASDPLYRWHLDRKGPHGDSESLLNQHIATAMRRERPDVLSVVAPLTRRLSLRGYDDRLDIAQTWCYTPGLRVVWLQEALTAHIRHQPRMRSSSFPAFLHMNAGPYPAMPSGDIFAASCWASLIRPTSMLVLFQALEMMRGHGLPKAEIDALLGSTAPNAEEAARVIRAKRLSFKGDHPTLAPRVRRLLAEELPPFRALLPAWSNAPRQIAVYSCFADSLFADQRWPTDYTPLLAELTRSGVAYDLLFDEDFTRDPKLLDGYDMVFIPNLTYLFEPAWQALRTFVETPGRVLAVPDTAHAFFPNAVTVRDTGGALSAEGHARIVREVESRFGTDAGRPAVIEALDARLAEAAAQGADAGPFAPLLDRLGRLNARCLMPHTALNVTRLDDTHFLSVVNDLRTWGPIYGHFRVLPERGVRQTGDVLFRSALGRFAYNLRTARRLAVTTGGNGQSRLSLTLDGGDAAILLLSDHELGRFRAGIVREGTYMRVTAQACDTTGREIDVSMPCRVAVEGIPDYSGVALFRKGKLDYRFPFDGTFPTVTLREEATGATVTLRTATLRD